MKKTWRSGVAALLMFAGLLGAAPADEKLELSQQDAKQLHAFLLTGELLDFGRRTSAPSAYLMACELMLDYPTDKTQSAKILKICKQARTLGRDDAFMQGWADRLELRASKKPRAPSPDFVSSEGCLQAREARSMESGFGAVWVTGTDVTLERRDRDGSVLERGPSLSGRSEQSGESWWLVNLADETRDFRLLERRGD